jgi:ABC-type glutathione transport system ATPase component
MPELILEDVSITYASRIDTSRGDVQAVRGVSLTLPEGGTLGIAGESGSGKSTLAMSILRLLPKSARVEGQVLLDGEDVLGLSWGRLRALRWSEAAVVFQGAMHSLNPVRRIGAQIEEALELHVKDDYRTEKARKARVHRLLRDVDLPQAKASSFPHELSGGQRQRAMIAMALACDPEMIIADEPTTALDVVVQAQVLELLSGLVRERGLSLIFISHDLSVLRTACERIAVMRDGVVLEEGPSEQVATAPRHPYTAALAAAFPRIGDPASRMHPVSRRDFAGAETAEQVRERGAADRARGGAASGEPAEQHAAAAEEAESPEGEGATSSGAGRHTGPGEVLLEARGLSVAFHTKHGLVKAVDDVSLECRRGEITALVGQSGSGKTTLARALLRLQPPTRGDVYYRGEALPARAGALKEFRRQVQLVLQDPASALNPKHSVYESVAEGLRIHGMDARERELVSEALAKAELSPPEDFFSAIPAELSGGQLQRVVIAGALALEPEFLVADEPVASLDASVRGEILGLLLQLRRTLGLGALVITHDLGLAWNIADRVMVMYEGKIVESGPVEDVLLHPQHDYTRTLLAAVPLPAAVPVDSALAAPAD